MRRLARFQAERDVPVYLVLFPIFRDLERHPLQPLHARVAGAAVEHGLRWIDLAGLFRFLHAQAPGQGVFDELHPDAVGYAHSALVVLHVLLSEGALARHRRGSAARPVGDAGRSDDDSATRAPTREAISTIM